MGQISGSWAAAAIFGGGQVTLDLNTLFLVTIYVEAILGLLLLFAWAQNTQIRAVAWWGSAHILRAGSIMLFGMFGDVSNLISIDFANAILFTTYALIWQGARVFDGRPAQPHWLLAGATLWLVVSHLPLVSSTPDGRFLVGAGIITAYTWLASYEFWRGRDEPLVSRWPAVVMLFAHGALFLLRTPIIALLPWSPTNVIFDSVWLAVLSFEALLFTIAIAFILLAMAKERIELRHKTAAMIDPLTGLANRRSFLQEGDQMMKRDAADPKATAVLLIDLDHFKSINDRFGHALGDRVLQVFADTAKAHMRTGDVIGRLGGEEFAAILPNAGRDRARAMAERVRMAFADAAAEVDGKAVGGTVSIGVVANENAPLDVPSLLAQADQALYCAKARGRNRVEIASLELMIERRQDAEASRAIGERAA